MLRTNHYPTAITTNIIFTNIIIVANTEYTVELGTNKLVILLAIAIYH